VPSGVLLLVGCAFVAGSPWTGSNFGAAITLFAAAGLWLAIRRRRPWWMVAVIVGAITAAGGTAIALVHRFLADQPTHVSSFLEGSGTVAVALDRLVVRLSIGFDQLVDTPAALIPVVGTLVVLVVVLRPPVAIARSFEVHDAWRDALLVLALGSIVAYLANDTGAAALGFGFGFALSGLLDVSLASARRMMVR
jgi:MYXO-CTERM domain-containing protein